MNSSAPAGGLTLRLRISPDGGREVEIASTRPQAAALLRGKTPEQAARMVPLLFSLCGGAQGVAARLALLAAQGGEPDAHQLAEWAAEVRREAAREHLWHLMLAWPPLCGLDKPEREYAECRRHLLKAESEEEHAAVLADILAAELLGMPPADWLNLGSQDWDAWRDGSPSLGAKLLRCAGDITGAAPALLSPRLLPMTGAADWLPLERQIATADYCAVPTWHGEPRETGALARCAMHPRVSPLIEAGHNVEARLLARMVELAHWACGETGAARDWADAVRCEQGTGLARVETARGTLLHRVRVADGLIAAYAAVAPTEWNFHPRGAYAREAAQLTADGDALLRQAERLALSLDPCVACEVVAD